MTDDANTAKESSDIDSLRQLVDRLTTERDDARMAAASAHRRQRRLVEATDQLRIQLSRELHGGAQQQFVNTLLYLRRSEQHWVEAPDEVRQLLELAVREAQSGIDGLRDLTSTIHPAILTTRGLAPALDTLVARLPCHVELRLAPERVPAGIEACTYFVCSEALANVVAHAKVNRASVTTTSYAGRFTVEVSDKGVGGATVRPHGGLEGIEDRVVAVGGSLHVTTPPAGGTTVTACFDVDPDS